MDKNVYLQWYANKELCPRPLTNNNNIKYWDCSSPPLSPVKQSIQDQNRPHVKKNNDPLPEFSWI